MLAVVKRRTGSTDKMSTPLHICEFKFETDDDLKKHVRSLHDEKCGRCDLAFKDKEKLKEHILVN